MPPSCPNLNFSNTGSAESLTSGLGRAKYVITVAVTPEDYDKIMLIMDVYDYIIDIGLVFFLGKHDH